jgi:uncharacterized protein (DUF1697 family)
VTATHAALLRGINVGHAKRVAMADLRRVLESLGATGVRTLLNSGNAVFTWAPARASAGAIAGAIEDAVETRLGVSALVVVLTRAEVARILGELPASVARLDPSRVLVGVPPASGDLRGLAPVAARAWSPEILELGGRAAIMGLPEGIADSRLVAAVDAAAKKRITSRNLATMRKILELM